jgi:hypothetical protein
MYGWVVLLHVLGAFAFVMAHGVSIVAAFRLRGERDPARQAQLLELSGDSVGLMYIGLAVLLLAGIVAGFMGDHWGRLWIWAAIATLLVVAALMYALATQYYGRMRAAAGVRGSEQLAGRLTPPPGPDDLAALGASSRPFVLAAIGGVGLVVIVWLMVLKPF